MSTKEIEAYFLNHDLPWFEKIQNAKSDLDAEIYAVTILAHDGYVLGDFSMDDLEEAVKNIRSA
jgi:hypothetical protein